MTDLETIKEMLIRTGFKLEQREVGLPKERFIELTADTLEPIFDRDETTFCFSLEGKLISLVPWTEY